MRLSCYALGVLSALVVSALADVVVLSASSISRRDGDHHMIHGPPLLELNETELTLHHQPIPESYYTIDFDDLEHASERHPGLMFLHATAMVLAWFVMLPAGEYHWMSKVAQCQHNSRYCNAFGESCLAQDGHDCFLRTDSSGISILNGV